jgi:integrase
MSTRRRPKLRQKKRHYYADFYDPDRQPTRKWVALGTTNKRVAQRKLTRLGDEYVRGDLDPWHDQTDTPDTLQRAINRYLQRRRDEGRVESSTKRRRQILEAFARTLPPETTLSQVAPDDVRRYVWQDRLARHTQNTYYTRLRTLFKFAIDENMLDGKNPTDDVRRPRPPQRGVNYLRQDEINELLRAVESRAERHARQPGEVVWYADVIRVVAGSGMRRRETCNLQWRDVDLDAGQIRVRHSDEHRTKSEATRTVQVSPSAARVLQSRHKRTPHPGPSNYDLHAPGSDQLSYPRLGQLFRQYREMTDVPQRRKFHSLRKSYGTRLASEGVPLRTIQKMLGHSDISITARTYADVIPRRAAEQVRNAFSSDD